MWENQACFGYRRGRCRVLAVEHCPGPGGCSFFKTTARLEQERRRVRQYIQALDEPKRRHIIERYYGGQIRLFTGK